MYADAGAGAVAGEALVAAAAAAPGTDRAHSDLAEACHTGAHAVGAGDGAAVAAVAAAELTVPAACVHLVAVQSAHAVFVLARMTESGRMQQQSAPT